MIRSRAAAQEYGRFDDNKMQFGQKRAFRGIRRRLNSRRQERCASFEAYLRTKLAAGVEYGGAMTGMHAR